MHRRPAPFQTDKQRHDRAGRHRPQPAPPPVGDKARHNRTVAVAALQGPGDYFNAQGQRIRHVPGGSQIRVVASNDVRLLSQVNVREGHNLQTVANVAGYYAHKELHYPGPYGASQARGESALAFSTNDDHTYLAANKAGYVSPVLDNYNNLKSVLRHERNHRDDFKNPKLKRNFESHFTVFVRQFADADTFAATTQEFKAGTIATALQYLYNSYMQGRENYQMTGFHDNIELLNSVLLQYDIVVDASPNKTDFSVTVRETIKINGKYRSHWKLYPYSVKRRPTDE